MGHDPFYEMAIRYTLPPNFKNIVQVFPKARGRGVIFTYGQVIHNPSKGAITDALKAHERVHSRQQITFDGGPAAWWTKYLEDPQWRYGQELAAHQAEYKWHADRWLRDNTKPNALIRTRRHIAVRLSSKLYGNVVSFDEAYQAIAE